ncbi:Squamosa promoter-binding-like protein 16 [Frankliniella fusca]|uniref:Squamosa promoter-binding-like protein 16 n=1 Tax=Frankliniella fusca TaxID=407009 RepID=A0AAE1HLU7_9NEOP|nr:Squamosa promoter-binding-like protein 16 [Frankliniella fusca]
MRYSVLRDLTLPLAPSDMRVLDSHISTAWCQAQGVRANGSFSAWVVGGRPERGRRRRSSLVRDIRLDDDVKEYWGFYLLTGSSVTVSPCARWPGVSLVVIRGYDHLQQCAYIGDDSSEEAEEVRRAALRQQLEESRRLRPPQPPPASPPAYADGQGGAAATPRPRQRSNLPTRMHVVKDEAIEFHEKVRPAPRVFHRLEGLEEAAASPEDAEGSAELARGVLERLRALGGAGRRALERLRSARLSRDVAEDENTAAEAAEPAPIPTGPGTGAGAGPAPGQDVHGWVNETTSLDESHSELWSSFSSSEEALLGCAGLVLSLPLTPHRQCQRRRPVGDLAAAAAANVITYTVPADGHYFFILGSENEVQTNFVRVRFDLDRVVYDIDSPVAECSPPGPDGNGSSSASSCTLPLRFLSDDTLVLEVPVEAEAEEGARHHAHHDHVLAVSTCEPRTALYVACILALPALILACAF